MTTAATRASEIYEIEGFSIEFLNKDGSQLSLVPNKFVSSCISRSFLLKGFTKKHTSSIVFCTFR